ncbi:MAG: DUF362 domain-containing protein [Thermoplasmata archaeon]|nr:MAG: DUF362 domain-containing protein [Thermoplasmata archaeon]
MNVNGKTATEEPASDIYVIDNTTGYDDGFTRLIDLMGEHSLLFYKTDTTGENMGPEGLIAADDVVIIKVNSQWNERGGTNNDLLKGIIQAIVDHPDGFLGEVVVVENGQGDGFGSFPYEGANLNWTNSNAEDHSQSIQDVVDMFSGSYNISTYLWDDITNISVTEYIDGNMDDGYVVNETANAVTGVKVSYPKFNTSYGTLISFKEGIWDPDVGNYVDGGLKLLNVPILKSHQVYGVTASVKHYMGVVSNRLYQHNPHDSVDDGGMGTVMAETRMPDLNILDAIWINAKPEDGPITRYNGATRVNIVVASVDPVALDYWAAKYILKQAASIVYPSLNRSSMDPDSTVSGSFGDWLNISKQEIQRKGYQVTNNENQMNVYTTTLNQYFITAESGMGGSISPSGTVTVVQGGNQTFTISADIGYHIENVLVDGFSVGAVSYYDFINVNDNHTIAATFIIQYEIELYNGWNLIGIPVTPRNTSVQDIFQENLTKVDYIYGFDNQTKEYSYWFQGLPPQLQTLTQLECGKGYWIHISEDFNETLTGSLGEKSSLYMMWNLIGVNGSAPITIEDYFAAELSTVNSIHSYNDVAKTYSTWVRDVDLPTELLYPGEGYWIKIESP